MTAKGEYVNIRQFVAMDLRTPKGLSSRLRRKSTTKISRRIEISDQISNRVILFRYSCIRQVNESCDSQWAQEHVSLTEMTKKHDIRTNYPTILHIVWIPSSKPMFTTTSFLTQMNPANFLPANNHPQFTGAPSHRAPRCTKHLSAWIARCTCAILVAKEVQKTVERDRLWEGREMNGKCVQCANSCVIAKCCGSAGAFSKLSEHWDV